MKTTRINLLGSRKDSEKIEAVLLLARKIILLYAILFVVFVVIILGLSFQQSRTLQPLLLEKASHLSFLNSRKDQEAKLSYIAKKVKALDTFILDDARFLPYYELILKALNVSTGSAALSSLSIDKERAVNFTITYQDQQTLLNSFENIESPQFLQNFEQLKLAEFASRQLQGGTNYQLSFQGIFRKSSQ